MKDTLVNKAHLRETLAANRTQHRDTFEKATQVYRRKVIERLDDLLERAHDGEIVNLFELASMRVPEDHTEDYDVAIAMLDDDTRDEVLLDLRSYRRFVMDQWEWRQSWIENTVSYSEQLGEG